MDTEWREIAPRCGFSYRTMERARYGYRVGEIPSWCGFLHRAMDTEGQKCLRVGAHPIIERFSGGNPILGHVAGCMSVFVLTFPCGGLSRLGVYEHDLLSGGISHRQEVVMIASEQGKFNHQGECLMAMFTKRKAWNII